MEQLVLVGIVVLFSILEAVARKGRSPQGEGAPPQEPVERRPRPQARPRSAADAPTGSVPHSYDEDATFDEAARGDDVRSRGEPGAREVPASEPVRDRTGSEGLIPPDVWDEIQRMARGEGPTAPVPSAPPPPAPTPQPRAPEPAQSRPPGWPRPSGPRPRPASQRSRPSGKAAPTQRPGASTAQPRSGKGLGRPALQAAEPAPLAEGTPDHPVHLAHEAFGTSPSHRPAGAGALPHGAPAAAVRKLLAGRPGALRQAVILQEILGPPPGLRDD